MGLNGLRTNAQASGPVLEEVARADPAGTALLRDAADSMRLTARGYHLEPSDTEQSGILRMLSKPFSPRHLLTTVNEVLEGKAA